MKVGELFEQSAEILSLVDRVFLFDSEAILGPDEVARLLDGGGADVPSRARVADAHRQLALLASEVAGLRVGLARACGIEAIVPAFALSEVLPKLESFARHLGLALYVPNAHEVEYPLALDEGDAFASALSALALAGKGWAILEAGEGLERYVQVFLPDDAREAHVEAVSNRHLSPSTRISATAVARARLLGWQPPSPGLTRNFWRVHALDSEGERVALGRLAARTLREVHGRALGDETVIRVRT